MAQPFNIMRPQDGGGRMVGGIGGAGGRNVSKVNKNGSAAPAKGWEKEIIKEAKKMDRQRRGDANKIQIIK